GVYDSLSIDIYRLRRINLLIFRMEAFFLSRTQVFWHNLLLPMLRVGHLSCFEWVISHAPKKGIFRFGEWGTSFQDF
ncbi:MAG: hypothetical protein LBG15_04915, partial [Dysgonamonadaceae bacterium]|nr:hypothetical protein [Dysgonamonadaceae bacterium]